MESQHFYLVVLDIEGTVEMFNDRFKKVSPNPVGIRFCDFLLPDSRVEFDHCLETMLSAPIPRRNLMLEHPESNGSDGSKVWWEFSVITTPEMDLSGVIGIGVGFQFLGQEMPWNSLVDILGFGKIVLDSDFNIQTWDAKISEWFDPVEENWYTKAVTEVPAFQGLNDLSAVFAQSATELKPRCLLIKSNASGAPLFAALITASTEGYHLFLVPKEISVVADLDRRLVPEEILSALPGAILVLDRAGKLCQQNEDAKKLGRIWKGRAYSEGFSLTFPTQANRFSKLLRAIEDAKKGKSADLELRILMPNKEFSFWDASVKPILSKNEICEGVLIQVSDMTPVRAQLAQTNRENERLRELALSPSHILRGPLSSMIGLLELIDAKQLDDENRQLFNYLKPLTKELDRTIRQHAKKMSTFD